MKPSRIILGMVAILEACVFDAAAHGGVTFTNLFSFSGTNGIEPEGQLLQTPDGNLYGTARDTTLERWGNANFGYNGNGTVFRITTNGAFSLLATFRRSSTNGAYPRAGLSLGKDGALYGTTTGGGINGQGTVFKITTNGDLKILYLFAGTNGSLPVTSLLKAGNGNFFGTTLRGGLKGDWGTIYSITPEGACKTLVHLDNTNGAHPIRGLIQGNDGYFYGTTSEGGLGWLMRNNLTNEFSGEGFGTVFKMTRDGALSTVVAFNGYNGMGPTAIAQGRDGNLYGITTMGGATNTANRDEAYSWQPFSGSGTIFKITQDGRFRTLVLFHGANGTNPDSFILGKDGNFYGTTEGGGANNVGTVFKLTPNGTFATLYSFSESGGTWPDRITLMQGIDGNLYGTTTRCGKNQCGSIFRLIITQ